MHNNVTKENITVGETLFCVNPHCNGSINTLHVNAATVKGEHVHFFKARKNDSDTPENIYFNEGGFHRFYRDKNEAQAYLDVILSDEHFRCYDKKRLSHTRHEQQLGSCLSTENALRTSKRLLLSQYPAQKY